MKSYGAFAKFYDQSMGDRTKTIKLIEDFIKKYCPHAKNILELAVGTGSIIGPLSKRYEVSGLDISKPMLKIAKKKVPRARLYHKDMIDFKIKERFDVVLCVFDSINHLLKYSDWEKVFENAFNHLNSNGVFIFDINTQYVLKSKMKLQPFVQKIENGIRVVDTEDMGGGVVDFQIYILSSASNGKHVLIEDHTLEKSFPVANIQNTLKKYFKQVLMLDRDLKKPNKISSRIYFVCNK